jgi:hypothetical protein
MRAVLAILAASLFSIANDGAIFKRGKDPHGKSMCACIGAAACSEMQKSDSCISGIECHSSQLGTIICSCKAVQFQRKNRGGDVTEPPSPKALTQSVGHATVYQATLKGLWPARACSRYGTGYGTVRLGFWLSP